MNPPDPTQVIDAATRYSWEAGIVALIVVVSMGLLAWMFRYMLMKSEAREVKLWEEAQKREERLAARITILETFINERLMIRLEENTAVKNRLADAIELLSTLLHDRPCIASQEVRNGTVQT
jgi:hypothetical protein